MAKAQKSTDKDMLFSKILPALNDNPFVVQPLELDIPALSDEDDNLSALRDKLFARSESAIIDSFATINVMENLVLKHMDSVIAKFNVCRCDRCRCDIAAYALNNLPPKYIVADPSRIAQVEEAFTTRQAMDALIKAVIQVRSSPRH